MNNYWKLKAAVLTQQLAMAQLQAEAEKVQAAYALAMASEDLDASKNYTFNDADESADTYNGADTE